MKRLLSTPLSLILAVFLLASSLVSCPDPSITTSGTETGGTDTEESDGTGNTDDSGSEDPTDSEEPTDSDDPTDNEDPTDTEDSSEPSEGLSFIQSGTCGFGGNNNPDVVTNDEFEGPAWTVSNNNWGGGIVFTIDLGSKTFADYSGFKCTIRRDSSGLDWKDIYLEHAPDGTFSSLNSDNVII